MYYPGGFAQYDPNDPFNPIPPDPAYDPDTHTYTWQLGDVMPDETGFAEITVVVTEAAQPGMRIENVAKMISAGMMVGWNSHETLVCCWDVIEPDIIYVDKNATGNNTGVDWQNAYTDLQSALYRATNSVCAVGGYTIYVAEGTYRPGDNVTDVFILPAGVSVYGGFKTGGSPFEERNPDRYVTTLTGFIGPDENNHIRRNETVVTMSDNTLLDGFTVTEGFFYGIYGKDADFVIENCQVIENSGYGIYAENGNIIVKWGEVSQNFYDGIYHIGTGHTLTLENYRIVENVGNGVRSDGSTPIIKNNVIAGNGYSDGGFFGISMYLPTEVPVLHNNTIAYNANAGVSWIDDVGGGSDPNVLDYPDIQNCILWYNNDDGEQLAGYRFTQYSCVFDPNNPEGTTTPDANGNITCPPGFAYEYSDDSNVVLNVHLAYDSPCKDKGSPYLSYTDQLDIDSEDRVVDTYADIGADEIYSCDGDLSADDVYHSLDWTADGIINFKEFGYFAAAWQGHDPNDPALSDPNLPDYESYYDPNSPDYVGAGNIAAWDTRCNLDGSYRIDAGDLVLFCDQWLWMACWKQSQMDSSIMMMGMGAGESAMMSVPMATTMSMDLTSTTVYDERGPVFGSESDLARFVNGVNEIIGFVDRGIKEDHPNSEALYEMKAALEEILMELRETILTQ